MAEIEVIDLLLEPVAAAIADNYFSLGQNIAQHQRRRVIVYDIGALTVEVSLLKVNGTKYHLVDFESELLFGSDCFDLRLAEQMINEFDQKYQCEKGQERDQACHQIREASKEIKMRLSQSLSCDFLVHFHQNKWLLKKFISRVEWEELNKDLFGRAVAPVYRLIGKTKINPVEIDELIMVGGASTIPKIQQMVEDVFKKKSSSCVNPKNAVVMGACIHGRKKIIEDSIAQLELLKEHIQTSLETSSTKRQCPSTQSSAQLFSTTKQISEPLSFSFTEELTPSEVISFKQQFLFNSFSDVNPELKSPLSTSSKLFLVSVSTQTASSSVQNSLSSTDQFPQAKSQFSFESFSCVASILPNEQPHDQGSKSSQSTLPVPREQSNRSPSISTREQSNRSPLTSTREQSNRSPSTSTRSQSTPSPSNQAQQTSKALSNQSRQSSRLISPSHLLFHYPQSSKPPSKQSRQSSRRSLEMPAQSSRPSQQSSSKSLSQQSSQTSLPSPKPLSQQSSQSTSSLPAPKPLSQQSSQTSLPSPKPLSQQSSQSTSSLPSPKPLSHPSSRSSSNPSPQVSSQSSSPKPTSNSNSSKPSRSSSKQSRQSRRPVQHSFPYSRSSSNQSSQLSSQLSSPRQSSNQPHQLSRRPPQHSV